MHTESQWLDLLQLFLNLCAFLSLIPIFILPSPPSVQILPPNVTRTATNLVRMHKGSDENRCPNDSSISQLQFHAHQ